MQTTALLKKEAPKGAASAFGKFTNPLQLKAIGEKEDTMQMKQNPLQLQNDLDEEEDEPLQLKKAPIQLMDGLDDEEEEPLQMKQHPLQRMEDEDEELLQKKENPLQLKKEGQNPLQLKQATDNPLQLQADEIATPQPKKNNTGLPDNLKAGVEALSGYSMDDVKVHYNSDKPAQLQALAYAQGTDIHVAPGQEKHLPHEAWHVVQQKQERVQPTMQVKGGIAVNDDKVLENEADEIGQKALNFNSKSNNRLKENTLESRVIQPMMGFELELLVLVDITGRPVPEKHFLGTYGTANLELQVDHNGSVEGTTPSDPASANYEVAKNLNPPINWLQLGPYDLPSTFLTRLGQAPGGPIVVDPRIGGLNFNMLNFDNWKIMTNGNRYRRPPSDNSIGVDNLAFTTIDNAIQQYERDAGNWKSAEALNQLTVIILAISHWIGHNQEPSLLHPINRRRYETVLNTLQNLRTEVNRHRIFWDNPANTNPPVGLERLYHQPAGGGHGAVPWSTQHPYAGQGTNRYASILEIVTPAYNPETLNGRRGLLAAMTQAEQLAQNIEAGTANFTNRIQLNTLAGANILNPDTFVGNANPTATPQSTDASIQSTFAIDLSQIGSLVKSTVAFGAPQNQLSLKHQSDVGPTQQNPGGVNRAELEMAIAVANATNVINDLKARIGMGAPSFVNLRGLVILVCQYLRLGKHWTGPGIQSLDKNLTDLLSRTDLARIYQHLVPPGEKIWLNAAAANRNFLINRIFHYSARNPNSRLLNNPNENRPAGGTAQFVITCQNFVNNIFTQPDDGFTSHLGGFREMNEESIDPFSRRVLDTRPVISPTRQGPVFEMRNMIPRLDGADRFPRTQWIPLTKYMMKMIQLLNSRTEAQAIQDVRFYEHFGGGPTDPPRLGNPENAW